MHYEAVSYYNTGCMHGVMSAGHAGLRQQASTSTSTALQPVHTGTHHVAAHMACLEDSDAAKGVVFQPLLLDQLRQGIHQRRP